MISVIVPAYNAASTLPDCLRALQQQTIPAAQYELILVDDGSTDDTAAIARRMGAHVVRQTRRGPAAARNLGVSVAQGQIIMFTDADCFPQPDWMAQMLGAFSDPQVMGVKGVYCTTQRALLPRFIQAEYADKYRRMQNQPRIDFIDTYSAAYRREVFDAHGGFNADFPDPSAEDIEFSFRLAEAGYWLVFAPRAVVRHLHAVSLAHYLRRKWRYGYWRVWVYQRHPNKLMGDSHTAPELKVQLGALALLGASLPLVLWRADFLWLSSLSAIIFFISTLPFVARTWRHDRAAALIAPVIMLLRTVALIGGLGAGMLGHRLNRWSTAWASRPRSS